MKNEEEDEAMVDKHPCLGSYQSSVEFSLRLEYTPK